MTTTFFLHRSNRIEQLVEVLVDVVSEPLADPFARECIVLQGKGMERWLAMYERVYERALAIRMGA